MTDTAATKLLLDYLTEYRTVFAVDTNTAHHLDSLIDSLESTLID